MIHVHIAAELQADEYGPHEVYIERLTLPKGWAKDASEAHAKLLTLLVTERYFELPQHSAPGTVPLNSETVRSVGVWEAPH